jgi:hypothetical protein
VVFVVVVAASVVGAEPLRRSDDVVVDAFCFFGATYGIVVSGIVVSTTVVSTGMVACGNGSFNFLKEVL